MEQDRIADPNSKPILICSIKPLLLVILSLIFLALSPAAHSLNPETAVDKPFAKFKPTGTFTWVDGRRASFIEAPIISLKENHLLERKTISFGKSLKWHDGTICQNWELAANHIYCAFLEDPMLSDTQIQIESFTPPLPLRNQGYQVLCEGIPIGSLTDIDGRTLIVPMYNSAVNGLFEKPVDRTIMLEMATKLRQKKYTSITPYMISTDEFRNVISSYVSQMGNFNLKFDRSPITRNLMHGLIESPTLRKRLKLDQQE